MRLRPETRLDERPLHGGTNAQPDAKPHTLPHALPTPLPHTRFPRVRQGGRDDILDFTARLLPPGARSTMTTPRISQPCERRATLKP